MAAIASSLDLGSPTEQAHSTRKMRSTAGRTQSGSDTAELGRLEVPNLAA